MIKSQSFSVSTKESIIRLFLKIDDVLEKEKYSLSITVLGGISLILLGFRNRSTLDIDIAGFGDSLMFKEICSKNNVPVDIVTVVSTVDFARSPKVEVFKGKFLTVNSILAEDIIKSKLERFRKQDPEDIYAVIKKTNLDYADFKDMVKDMLLDYIGNHKELILSAKIVVENIYPEYAESFEKDVL